MRLYFGNENAEHDGLLEQCYINRAPKNKTIITGRWGTGKTAHLISYNRELSKVLKDIDDDAERKWYLSEDELSTDQLLDAYAALDDRKFQRYLSQLWEAEIYRRITVVIGFLYDYYPFKDKPHWKFLNKISKTSEIRETIWQQIPVFLQVFKKMDEGQIGALVQAEANLSEILSDKVRKSLKKCLQDINEIKSEISPSIAIEPIETPLSKLEKHGSLAQQVISSLLNVYQKKFQPDENQLVEVRISIPWHRYSSLELNLPQKIRQYRANLSWEKDKLREFISTRIRWEFIRVKRQYVRKDEEMNMLLENTITNNYCNPNIQENTFDYILRHTHYRPREVQRIMRMTLELCAEKIDRDPDFILRGTGGIKIPGSYIAEAIANYCRDASADLVEESMRRYPKLNDFIDSLKGMNVPFTTEELAHRLAGTNVTINQALEILWESGFIGIEIACLD
ncbi:MAG: hypothetical protein KI791_01435 [Cyclobacteriaceae bacterium]|nr:hypothetical protein [Cyclobacteriaceae bacterium SS2]